MNNFVVEPRVIRLLEFVWTEGEKSPPPRPAAGKVELVGKEEAEKLSADHVASIARCRLYLRGTSRTRRSKRWRSWRRDFGRVEFQNLLRLGPSRERPVAWRVETTVQLGDWVDDKMYDTVQFGAEN